MHYAVFIPGARGARDHLSALELPGLDGAGFEWISQTGPESSGHGSLGVVRTGAPSDPPGEVRGYDTWTEQDEGWWLGYDSKKRPAPGELKRAKVVPGEDVTLADGNGWHIPYAWKLPEKFRLVDGEWIQTVQREYEDFFDEAESIMLQLFAQIDVIDSNPSDVPEEQVTAVSLSVSADICSLALSVNYRICPQIASELGLFTTDNVRQVVMAICQLSDIISVRELKKNGAAHATGV